MTICNPVKSASPAGGRPPDSDQAGQIRICDLRISVLPGQVGQITDEDVTPGTLDNIALGNVVAGLLHRFVRWRRGMIPSIHESRDRQLRRHVEPGVLDRILAVVADRLVFITFDHVDECDS